jgi:hypothetical protein
MTERRTKTTSETWIRQFPIATETARKFKSAAALAGKKIPELLREIVEEYVARENRKGKR